MWFGKNLKPSKPQSNLIHEIICQLIQAETFWSPNVGGHKPHQTAIEKVTLAHHPNEVTWTKNCQALPYLNFNNKKWFKHQKKTVKDFKLILENRNWQKTTAEAPRRWRLCGGASQRGDLETETVVLAFRLRRYGFRVVHWLEGGTKDK